ncbi:uncharacterized protein [Ptychodera flava]|uniref:uncharacterized protein n=1 Tax=Ptychodera flava TaxID=63121 RepID=UPI00396A0220
MHMKKRMIYSLVIFVLLSSFMVLRHFTVEHHREVKFAPTIKEDVTTIASHTSEKVVTTPPRPKEQTENISVEESVSSTTLSPDELPKRHTCKNLDRYITSVKADECPILFEFVRNCLNTTDSGRAPLPNFFSERNNGGDTPDDAYRNANVAFVHMPKAGGTSVEKVLENIPGLNKTGRVRKMRVAHCRDFYRHSVRFRKYKDQTFFFSKRTFGLHDFAYPGRPFAYATWFREPIDRLISTFYYTKRTHCFGVHRICIHYLARSENLTDYLQKTTDIHFQDMDNFYVRLLQFGDFPDVDEKFEDCCGGVEFEDAKTIPKIEEKHYLVARKNLLTKIAFVGLTEDFKISQDILSYVFGIPLQNEETHVNANPHKYNVTDTELEELRRRNIWDLKLYEEATQIYYHQKKMYLDIKKRGGVL